MKNINISVVIPVYNGAKFLESTILSVILQTRQAAEIIIHDDNSNDGTYLICKKFKDEITYVKNLLGPSGFVNGWKLALSNATSDYISILHQDDLLYPTFIEEMVKAITLYPDVKHYFSFCNYINGNNEIINNAIKNAPNPFYEEIHLYTGIEYFRAYQMGYPGSPHIHRCPGVVTHRSIFENGCNYNPAAGHIADDDFFYRVAQYTNVVGIFKPLAAYRIHNLSETGRIGDTKLVERLSNDYISQIEQWKNSNFITSRDLNYFISNAYLYTKRLMGYGLRYFNIRMIKIAIKNANRLKRNGYKTEYKLFSFIVRCFNFIIN